MRKPELAAAIAEKADLTKEQANRVLNAVLEEITGALHRKDSVTLSLRCRAPVISSRTALSTRLACSLVRSAFNKKPSKGLH